MRSKTKWTILNFNGKAITVVSPSTKTFMIDEVRSHFYYSYAYRFYVQWVLRIGLKRKYQLEVGNGHVNYLGKLGVSLGLYFPPGFEKLENWKMSSFNDSRHFGWAEQEIKCSS